MPITKRRFENQLSGLLLKIEGNEVWVKLIGTLMLIIYWHLWTSVELGG
jgi:UDP-N-acetylmuramoyl-L-alanyl-D-glutamate--2,6-diaminopimelate ligase